MSEQFEVATLINEINDFLTVSDICLQKYFDQYFPSHTFIIPYLVNSVFCMELCLKYINSTIGRIPQKHTLIGLYDELERKDKVIFEEMVEYFQNEWKRNTDVLDKDITMRELMQNYDVYFTKVRYLYEGNFNYDFMMHYPNIVAHILKDFCVMVYERSDIDGKSSKVEAKGHGSW